MIFTYLLYFVQNFIDISKIEKVVKICYNKNMEVFELKKSEIKNILFSMRTADNEEIINNLLGKIDLLSEEKLQAILKQVGDNEEDIRSYLQEKIASRQKQYEPHTQINEMFSYGISGNTIHLHMPVDLHEMFAKIGISKTIDTVNLYLLDAIERIRKMQAEGFYKFFGKDHIYMISPILLKRELNFLDTLDFKTHTYKKKALQDEQFVSEHPDSQLAVRIFGKNKDIGIATIGLDIINSQEWQEKMSKQLQLFEKNGISLESKEKSVKSEE